MSCFWNGILHQLRIHFSEFLKKEEIKNIKELIIFLQSKNTKNINVKWNNIPSFTEKQLEENYIHIKEYNIKSVYNGYLCSTCDPFLILISEILNVDIIHNYCGSIINYININNNKKKNKILRFHSNRSHFSS